MDLQLEIPKLTKPWNRLSFKLTWEEWEICYVTLPHAHPTTPSRQSPAAIACGVGLATDKS